MRPTAAPGSISAYGGDSRRLLQHDRRRIELMNGLLLSMPGTPVIYYGDEIGMGDNMHLGDRDGVRTPMQWTEDRNGGFSRADPGSMVLPPIMGSVYGYAALNVEAQTKDQHSLLNWMRRMLTLRRSHKVFGRGAFQFLYPRNRRILAYTREFEGQTVLCVANLSRTPQAVELDLSAYAGRVPIELTGPSAFPPIGQLNYLLTLPPYAFYWFELKASTEASPSWRDDPPEQLPEFQTLVVRESLRELLGERHSATILQDLLPAYLQRRRWFASKNEAISSVRIAYAAAVPDNREIMLTEIEVKLPDRAERYLVPAGIAWEGATAQAAAPAARHGAGEAGTAGRLHHRRLFLRSVAARDYGVAARARSIPDAGRRDPLLRRAGDRRAARIRARDQSVGWRPSSRTARSSSAMRR